MHEPFALLLPVFGGDRAEHFERAFRSSVHDQFLPPDQVVLVQDGPVDIELANCIARLRDTSPVPVTYVPLQANLGLGPALDLGLEASDFDVVARMDADDVSMPWRFQVQLPLIETADIVGAGLLEFTDDTDQIVGRRVPPVEADVIREYARLHDPFNHPTVVYRRQAVQAAGGYGGLRRMEDYWLFARMLADGAEPVNVAEPLVYYRVGSGAYQRRGGAGMLRAELALQREMRRAGLTSGPEYARNLAVRGGYRLVPWRLRRNLYSSLVATRFEPVREPVRYANGEPAFGLV
ncbi:MAG TPA: glycosyltransferase [Mycobacteriales bacterium]|nr:glycosyltransferase [Mycobacteriales bacterium]